MSRGIGAAALWLALAMDSPAWAANGNRQTFLGNGLAMAVDTTWTGSAGYRPVTIEFTASAPQRGDRRLLVEFQPRVNNSTDVSVVHEIVVPARSGRAAFTLAVPQRSKWSKYTVRVYEDGFELKQLSPTAAMASTFWITTEELPTILFVDDVVPDTSSLAEALGVSRYQPWLVSQPSITAMPQSKMQLPTALARPLAALPEQWIEYSALDVVCLSHRQLIELAQRYPRIFDAIRQWARAGGNLWIYGAGRQWQNLPEIERLLRLSAAIGTPLPLRGKGQGEGASATMDGWTRPNDRQFGLPLEDADFMLSGMGSGVPSQSVVTDELQGFFRPTPPSEPHFVWRDVGMGAVAAFAPQSIFPGTVNEWRWVLNSITADRLIWFRRHGVSMERANPDFWNFLIPGVGLAPVTAFRVLITLFVLAIGPVNYYLLRRASRLHLMIITTPLSAGLITAGLFGYALVSDGFAIRVRARSVTRVDQALGEAVCWSRLSYYAGVAPSGGLRMPADVAVLPISPVGVSQGPAVGRRELIWNDEQQLSSGWLNARTSTQLLTLRARRSQLRLDIRDSRDADSAPRVTNQLATRTQQLLLRDAKGAYYWGGATENGAEFSFMPIEPDEAQRRLFPYMTANRPAVPEGIQTTRSGSYFGFTSRPWFTNSAFGQQLSTPSLDESLLEKSLRRFTLPLPARQSLLEPRSYLAIVERSPEVELGVTGARDEGSLHVILGTW